MLLWRLIFRQEHLLPLAEIASLALAMTGRYTKIKDVRISPARQDERNNKKEGALAGPLSPFISPVWSNPYLPSSFARL